MAETKDVVTLGGNIELVGFKDIEPASMVVLKKMVGTYAKTFSEKHSDFEKLVVELKNKDSNEVMVKLHHGGNVKEAQSSANNLFIALDEVMKKIE